MVRWHIRPNRNGKSQTRMEEKIGSKICEVDVAREFISDIGKFKLKCYISFSPKCRSALKSVLFRMPQMV